MDTIVNKVIFSPLAEQLKYRAVAEEDIQALEDALLFEVPYELKSFYRERGSFYYWCRDWQEEDTDVIFSAEIFKVSLVYNRHEFPLHTFLSLCIANVEALGDGFLQEKEYLNNCFAVYASIDELVEGKRYMEYFYFDALGNYGSLRFENREDVDISSLINELIDRKRDYQAFLVSRHDKTLAIQRTEIPEKEDEETVKDQEKTSFLAQYHLRAINYQEALSLLGVEHLFGYHDLYGEGGEGEFLDEMHDHEAAIIFYSNQDVEISGDFAIPNTYGGAGILIVVDGNLTVQGKMRYSYYVTGDATFDFLDMNLRQTCLGKEVVKFIQHEGAEDHEAIYVGKPRLVTAPFFFSWFADLNVYEFSPETCIYGLYNWSEQKHFRTNNPYFLWQEPIFLLRPELTWSLSNQDSDEFIINIYEFYAFLKAGKSVFIDGFDPMCLPLYREGRILMEEENYELAFIHFKEVIDISPGFYLAYQSASQCLKTVNAYSQAKTYAEKGIPLLPTRFKDAVFHCAETAALCAIILKDYEQALTIADVILQRHAENYFALRLKAEIFMERKDVKAAKSLLEKSIALASAFTNHWLLGLIYFQEGDEEQASYHYRIAKRNNSKAEPYTSHQNLAYFYGSDSIVDWDSKTRADFPVVEKDQGYWNAYFEQKLKNTPLHNWGESVIRNIPEKYRTRLMLEEILTANANTGFLAKYFSLVIDKALATSAVTSDSPCSLSDLPNELIDKEICLAVHSNLILSDVPEGILDYDICYKAVSQYAANFNEVPRAFKDEKMKIAAIVGGALKDYSSVKLPAKYYEDAAIFQALDISLKTLENIPPRYINKAIYNYGFAKYGETIAWKELVSRYDREAYKKTNDLEFDYQTFSRVWACFWDEHFILNAINTEGEGERINSLPKQYLTQRIVEAAVARDASDFPFVPIEFITPELCKTACMQTYANALEFVPLTMRTTELCTIAVGRGGENIAFVPNDIKTVDMCVKALLENSNNLKYIPYALYSSVFDQLLKKHSNTFRLGFIYQGLGLGAFYGEKYKESIAHFQKVQVLDEDEATKLHQQQGYYYEGWANYKLNRLSEARVLFDKAIAAGEYQGALNIPYDEASLPPVLGAAFSLDKYEFSSLMEQAAIQIENEDFADALDLLQQAESMLTEAQCSDDALWAVVWDHQRFALYEVGKKEEAYALCEKSIATLSKIRLWDYLEEFNPIRHTLRAMHNMLAYRIYERAKDLPAIKEGLNHARLSLSIISPIEDSSVLDPFYETQALLLLRATLHDEVYKKDLNRILTEIRKLKLSKKGVLSEEFNKLFNPKN